jgi:NAD(P)-dependent dehydrogenase (short-subunit alcohol dehydrogenase family)
MDLQLRHRRAVVTGGSSGIGAAIVRAFAAEGCHVHFCGRSSSNIARTYAECAGLPATVAGQQLDVTDAKACAQWFEHIGDFDIFIPNVSALTGAWDASLDVDVRATVAVTELALPILERSSVAAITYIGSKAASLAAPNAPAYGAAKAAMAHYMKSLAARHAPRVRVNTVSPGDTFVSGGFWDRVRLEDPSSCTKALARNPLGRLASPEEIARVAVFLSSPMASFVSGANWYVDGGSINHVQI